MRSKEAEMGLGLAFAMNLCRLGGVRQLGQRRGSLRACVYYAHAVLSFVIIIFLSIMSISGVVMDVSLDMQNATRLVFVSETRPEFFMWLIHLVMVIIVVNTGMWTARGRLVRIQKLYTGESFKINNKKWPDIKRIAATLVVLSFVIYLELQFFKLLITALLSGDSKVAVLGVCILAANEMLYIISTVLIVEFMFIIYAFHAAMVSLNEELIAILTNFNKIRTLTSVEEENVSRIGTTYIFIGQSVHQFNNTDGIVLLLILIYLYHDINTVIYRNIDSILRYETVNIESVIWLFAYIGTMTGIFEPCHQFQKEVDRLRVIMAKLMYRCTLVGRTSASVVQACCEQVEGVNPVLYPLGVCSLTRSLLMTAMSATVTSLVFMAQSRTNKSQ